MLETSRFRQAPLWLAVLAFVILLVATACSSSASPTRPAVTPTRASVPPPTTSGSLPATLAPNVPTTGPGPAGTSAPLGLTPAATLAPVTQRATRSPATIVPTSRPAATTGHVMYSVVTGEPPQLHTLWAANADGSGAHQVLESAAWPALSPDGRRLAFYQLSIGVTNPGLYISNADGGASHPAFVGSGVCCMSWSRDGAWIAFSNSPRPSRPGGPISMLKIDGLYKTIVDLKVQGINPSFSPDGSQIVFAGCVPDTNNCGLLATKTDGNGVIRVITKDNGGNAHWAPSGSRIVYQANDSAGHHQVFVVNQDGSGKKQLTSGKSNDGQPIWSRDGASIFWRSDQNGTGWAIYVMNADGTNQRRIIQNAAPDQILWAWESLTVGP